MTVALILLLGLFLRLINLNQSLWLDEAVQAITSQGSFAGIFAELTGDFHPPFYHILMWVWVHLFGASEVILRLPSVLFGVGTIWVVYKIGEIGGIRERKRLGQVAGLLMAVAPYHIYYSQEARMYAMVTFFASLSMYWFLRMIGENGGDRGKRRNKGDKGMILGYVLATTAMLYSDYYGFLVLLAQIIFLLIFKKKFFSKFLKLYISIFLLFLPCFSLLWIQLKTGFQATQNLPEWGTIVNVNFLKALPLTFLKFSIGRITIFDKRLYALVALGILGTFGMIGIRGGRGAIRERGEKRAFYLAVLLWLLVPILVAWLVSLFIPNYQPFRLLLALPAFYLLLAIGINSINSKILRFLALFFSLFTFHFSLFTYFTNPYFHREDWRGVANYLKKEQLPIVISSKTFDWPLVYYGLSNQTISVSSGVRPVGEEDEIGLIRQIRQIGKKEVTYTPYLADVYDPLGKVSGWLNEAGFVKIKEVSFNQIPVWIYAYRN